MRAGPLAVLFLFLVSGWQFGLPVGKSTIPPTTFATDYIWAYFQPGGQVELVSPSLETMSVVYNPPASYPDSVVARVGFDQTIQAHKSNDPTQSVSSQFFRVVNPLVGRRVDGTWTIVESMETNGGPHATGLQLSLAGKVFNDVMPNVPSLSLGPALVTGPGAVFQGLGSEPIENGGTGRFAADLSSNVKIWNWHEQVAGRYDVGISATQNQLNPEQDPKLVSFQKGIGTEVPTSFATESDGFWVHLGPFTHARLVSPDGKQMSVTYNPLGDGSACSLLAESYNCLEPAVVHVTLDGVITSARQAYHPGVPVSLRRFTVQGWVTGAVADGTWTIETGANQYGLPSGIRVTIQGKTFDDVDSSPGVTEIETTGTGDVASGAAPVVRSWNWHMQDPSSSYHAYLGSQTTSVESPANARYLNQDINGLPAAPPINAIDLPKIPEKVKLYQDPSSGTCAFVDDNGNAQPDPNELQACVPPAGASVDQTLPTRGTLGSPQFSSTGSPYTYQFSVAYTGLAPPTQVDLVIDGSYWTTEDAVFYPDGYGGPAHHVMTTQDIISFDGAVYQVVVQLEPGPHTFHFEAVDSFMRWVTTTNQAGPTV